MQCREVAVPNSPCHYERREEDEVIGLGSIEQSRDRSPKTWLSLFTRANELVDDAVSKACSPYSRARSHRDGEALHAAEVWKLIRVRNLR
jgi:hypothetical protein